MKKIVFILLFILLIPVALFLFYLFDDKDYCLDTAICKEGLEINTEYGLVKINKENCLKYGWIWDDDSKMCNMRD